MPGKKRVAIIGGGISGLAAAHRLHELDPTLDVVLFESSDRVGGVIRSETSRGFCTEYGPDCLLTSVPWGVDLCRRTGIANDLIETSSDHRGVYTVHRGRLHKVPVGLALMAPQRLWPILRSRILSIRGKLRLAGEYFVPPRRASSEESLTQFATRRLGREAFERLVQPLVSGVYMGSPDCLSVKATFPRFVEMEAKHGGLIRAMRAQQRLCKSTKPGKGNGAGPHFGMFVAPRGGMEQLPKAIVARLPSDCIRLQCQVKELSHFLDDRWRIVSQNGHDDAQTEFFDGVVVATSAPAAARLLHDASPALAAELSAIEHTSCVVVNVALRRDQLKHLLDASGLVCPLIEKRSITACTFSSVKYSGRAPEGWHLLRVFLGGASDPQAVDWADNVVRQVVLGELDALLGVRGQPLFFRIQRWRRCMPQYELDHLERVERIQNIVEHLPGLMLAGNAYNGPGMSHCIHSGELAAERLHAHLEHENASPCCELSA